MITSKMLLDDLLKAATENTGNEPSISVFYRAFDELKSYVELVESKLAELDKQEPSIEHFMYGGFPNARFNGYQPKPGDKLYLNAKPSEAVQDDAKLKVCIDPAPIYIFYALSELVDLMRGVIEGDYKPDSFTLQPAKIAMEKYKSQLAIKPKESFSEYGGGDSLNPSLNYNEIGRKVIASIKENGGIEIPTITTIPNTLDWSARAETTNLVEGCFYWTKTLNDPDAMPWESDWVPARYAGEGLWDFIGVEGSSDWQPSFIGEAISKPDIKAQSFNVLDEWYNYTECFRESIINLGRIAINFETKKILIDDSIKWNVPKGFMFVHKPIDAQPKESVEQRITEQDVKADVSVDRIYCGHKNLADMINGHLSVWEGFINSAIENGAGENDDELWHEHELKALKSIKKAVKFDLSVKAPANKAEVTGLTQIGTWNQKDTACGPIYYDSVFFRNSFPHGSPVYVSPLPPLKDGAQ